MPPTRSPRAPYLIVAIDLVGGGADHPDVHAAFEALPLPPPALSLGVENVFAFELSPSRYAAQFEEVQRVIRTHDALANGRLRWMVQLCERPKLSVG